jgi:CubicO group peptidase (beta-lactamase class C family)
MLQQGGLANTLFWCDPQEDIAVIFMTQVRQFYHTIVRLLRFVYCVLRTV